MPDSRSTGDQTAKSFAATTCVVHSAESTYRDTYPKRYEHGAGAVKVDTRIRFPHMLDVRECCVASHDENESMDPLAYVYDLLTVVVHEGSLTSGHYTNYSKWRGQWYRFDDDKVTRVSLQQVLEARAYQLFYLRKRLRNNPSHGIDI